MPSLSALYSTSYLYAGGFNAIPESHEVASSEYEEGQQLYGNSNYVRQTDAALASWKMEDPLLEESQMGSTLALSTTNAGGVDMKDFLSKRGKPMQYFVLTKLDEEVADNTLFILLGLVMRREYYLEGFPELYNYACFRPSLTWCLYNII